MCGIAGVVGPSSKDLLEAMASRMQTRGPDSQGVWSKDQIGFAHRRLRVIDLNPRSDQPMLNQAQTVCIVFNGEIYNFRELRNELEKKGRRFLTASDTEVALQAFEEWGEASFVKFNGMFAIGIADFRDSVAPKVVLVRDRFGIKPLYYSVSEGKLAFASDVRSLCVVPWISREMNPQTLFWYLKFSHVPHPESIFRNISQLEPGAWMSIRSGVVKTEVFWDWSKKFSSPHVRHSNEEWHRRTAQTISSAVRRQMVSDVPVGCFISGGIDSSLLLAEAVKINPRIETFTIGYSEAEFDETPYACQVAEHYGVGFNPIRISPRDIIDWIPRLPEFLDQPLADPTLIPTLFLCQNARAKVTVALSGDGGDELFFGYRYQQALWYLYPLLKLPQGLKNSIFSRLRALLHHAQNPRFHQWLKALDVLQFRSEAELFQNFIGTIGPIPLPSIRDLFAEHVRSKIQTDTSVFQRYVDELEGVKWAKKIEAMFIRTFLVDTVLAKSDRTGMSFGLEVRVPFLDDELLELSMDLPFHLKHRGLETKSILRARLAEELPRNITQRPKRGFGIPIRHWMRGPLLPVLNQYLNHGRLEREKIFDPSTVGALLRENQSGVMNHSHLLWSLLVFQVWNEKNRGVLT